MKIIKGRMLDVEGSIKNLEDKKCEFKFGKEYNFIDISKAKNLGNKSWGRIDFLTKHYKHNGFKPFYLIGMKKYATTERELKRRKM